MAKMIDLKQISTKNTFDIKMFDDTILKLKKPSQRMFLELQALQDMSDDDYIEVLVSLYHVMHLIINNNTDGIKYDRAYIEENFDIELIKVVIEAYFKHAQELMSAKN